MTKFTIWDPTVGERPANLPLTNNYAATTAPAVGNDSSQGYQVGSSWVNTATGTAYVAVSVAVGAAVWVVDAQSGSLGTQGAPTAKTVSATLTAAEINAGIITVNQGGGAASALQLPAASAMDTFYPQAAVGSSFDFSVINISTVAAESASLTTNTNWTLVGDMDILANSAATTKSAARFRARRTAANTWTLYRLS